MPVKLPAVKPEQTLRMISPSWRLPSLVARPVRVISFMKIWLPRRSPYSGTKKIIHWSLKDEQGCIVLKITRCTCIKHHYTMREKRKRKNVGLVNPLHPKLSLWYLCCHYNMNKQQAKSNYSWTTGLHLQQQNNAFVLELLINVLDWLLSGSDFAWHRGGERLKKH